MSCKQYDFFCVNNFLILIIHDIHTKHLDRNINLEIDMMKMKIIMFHLGHVLRVGDHKHSRWRLLVD